MKISYVILIAFLITLAGCKKEKELPPSKTGKIAFTFSHDVDGTDLVKDTMIYINEAGNKYEVNEIQYFISGILLHGSGGATYSLKEEVHYADIDIPSTLSWNVSEQIPAGEYTSITFIFGLDEQKNMTGAFPDPPESNMFWPVLLGGGYHYMKLNGKWLDLNDDITPFNFHLGIGQDTTTSPVTFTHNYFNVTLQDTAFKINEGGTTTVEITMNIENWFRNPHTWDHNVIGGMIMQNQSAMQMACENGNDVFSMKIY